jgi:16S rRNA (uracil1498-N3)-methyltransferase
MRRGSSQITRIYVPHAPAPGAVLALPAAPAHHLSRVLRAAVGDAVVVFNGGAEFAATIIRIDKSGVTVKTSAGVAVDRESPLTCTLAQAVSSGERMDVTLQKSVELGIKAVQPLFSERSIVRLDAERSEKRVAHWRQIVVSACEQCGRNVIPSLSPPLAFTDWLGSLPPAAAGETRLLLSPRATLRLADLPRPDAILLLAGPEGGYTAVESALAQRYGFTPLRLGPRVLRTETAAMAALAAMNTLWGDF